MMIILEAMTGLRNNPRIILMILTAALALQLGLVLFGNYDFSLPIPADSHGFQIGRDFAAFHTAAAMLHTGPAELLYDDASFQKLLAANFPTTNTLRWGYAPGYLPVIYPLGYMGYVEGLAVYSAAFLAIFMLLAAKGGLKRIGFYFCVFSVPFLTSIFFGQNGILFAGIIFAIFYLRHEHKLLAACLVAFLALTKPQIGFLLPVMMIVKKEYRIIICSVIAIMVYFVLTILIWGVDIWKVYFFESLPAYFSAMTAKVFIMPTFYSALKYSIFADFFWPAFIAIGTFMLFQAIKIWRRNDSIHIDMCAYAAAIFIISPYYLVYDMMLLTLAIALVWQGSLKADTMLLSGFFYWLVPMAALMAPVEYTHKQPFTLEILAIYFAAASILFIISIKSNIVNVR